MNYRRANAGIIALALFSLLLTNLLLPSAIWADDKSCWIVASMEKVHVRVTEMDADGAGETTLWQGWIEQGDRQRIESTQGQIIFSYRMASEDRTYGDNSTFCSNGNTVSIP